MPPHGTGRIRATLPRSPGPARRADSQASADQYRLHDRLRRPLRRQFDRRHPRVRHRPAGLVCPLPRPEQRHPLGGHLRPRPGAARPGGVREVPAGLDPGRAGADRGPRRRDRRQDAPRLRRPRGGPGGDPHGLGVGDGEQAVAGPSGRRREVQRDHGDPRTCWTCWRSRGPW